MNIHKLAFIAVAFLLSPVSLLQAETLRVAVASNFAPIAKQLRADFESTSSYKLIFSAGSSGVLFAQISKGAPFDVFLSADAERPKKLEQLGLVVDDSRKTYAIGQLVWWQPDSKHLSLDSISSYTGRLAIANPRFAPYGQAAMSVLARAGATDVALVRGANVSQTFQFVDSGNASAALVPLSLLQLLSISQESERGQTKYQKFVRIPGSWHKAIEQQLVVVKRSKKIKAALEFSDFLLSNASQEKIAKLGYKSP